MAVRLQIRNDTAANWTAANPILATGELAIETDTRKFKIGNGSQSWNSLLYATQGEEGPQGPKGDPITVDSTWFDASGNTVIKFSDNTEVTVAKGTDGDDGTSVTVTSSSYDANGNTVVYFSDSSNVTIYKGKDGADGADGNVGYTAGDNITITEGNVINSTAEGDGILQSPTAPTGIEEGRLWLDTSSDLWQETVFEGIFDRVDDVEDALSNYKTDVILTEAQYNALPAIDKNDPSIMYYIVE